MSNLTAEERGAIALPAEAHEQECGGCGSTFIAPHETISVDEGDGGAMVNLVCSNPHCGCESVHYFTLSDQEYEAVFGHAFGEDLDDEDEED